MKTNCFLSVIICTYNREKYIQESLNCIATQSLKNEFYELVIVNNNSTDHTDSICVKFKSDHPDLNIKYIFENESGLSYARNKGIKESSGDVLIFLDDDAMASESYLSNIRSCFSENEKVLAGGGKILPQYESHSPDWMSKYLLPLVSALNLGDEIRSFPKNKYPIGANMFFRKIFFEEHGDFNTDLGRKGKLLLGGEEKDVFQRINQSSNTIIYLPNAVVRHVVPKERLEETYIDNMATGVGISEIIRIKTTGSSITKMYLKELYKWVGSVVLYILFLLKFEHKKGRMIIRFRYFVSRGMLLGKKFESEQSGIFH